jgi:hypothetical protein
MSVALAGLDSSLDELQLGALSIDEKTANELRHAISGTQMRRDEELLIRIERSLLRIERGQSLMLNLLHRLVVSATRAPEVESKSPREERRRGRDKSEERK